MESLGLAVSYFAGGLPGDETIEADLSFQAGDVLSGVIGHTRNGVTIGDEVARARISKRCGALAEKALADFLGFRSVLGQLDDLPFGDAANLIEMQAALALGFIGIDGRTEKSVGDHGERGDRRTPHSQHKLPFSEQCFQRSGSVKHNAVDFRLALRESAQPTLWQKKFSAHLRPTVAYSTESPRVA